MVTPALLTRGLLREASFALRPVAEAVMDSLGEPMTALPSARKPTA